MNTEQLYHINNFYDFNNIFTIYKKHVVTYKRVTDNDEENVIETGNKKYKVLSDYYKYIPVYGHYYNNNNHFICKKIKNHNIFDEGDPNNFLIVKDEELVRPYKGGIYKSNNIDGIYDIIKKIKGST